jgi:chromate transport protein ChrA
MTAARIWKIYRERLADDRRVKWATGLGGAAFLAAAWFAPWVLVLVAFYGALAFGLLRCNLFEGLLPADPDYDEF